MEPDLLIEIGRKCEAPAARWPLGTFFGVHPRERAAATDFCKYKETNFALNKPVLS